MARAEQLTAPLGLGDASAATAPENRATFIVENMNCGGCMRTIESSVGALAGVHQARANLSAKRLTVLFDPSRLDAPAILDALDGAGFRAVEFSGATTTDGADKDLLKRVGIAGFAAANIMLLSVSVWAGLASDMDGATATLFHWLSALIALPAVAYAGQPFFRSAKAALKGRRLNMDVPISLAIILATAMSLFQTVQGSEQVYFDAAVTLLFFLLIGRTLDQYMRSRARGAAQNLMSLRSSRATLLDDDGGTRSVAPADVIRGDKVLVAAGDGVPVDGRIRSGTSEIDESLITGESKPRMVGPGDTIYAGTVNLGSPLQLEATASDDTTLLAELARLMEAAEQNKGRYVRLADRAAGIYAPVVHILGALTFLAWIAVGAGWEQAMTIAISVLIITCPCALALAVPTVQVAAAARLFSRGIVLKSSDGLERLADIDTIIFDKTGTLTVGRPELVGEETISDSVLGGAAALATSSRHPYSRAIVRAARSRGLDPSAKDGVTETPGSGLEWTDGTDSERLGSPTWCGLDPEERTRANLCYRDRSGNISHFTFEDRLRSDALDVVDTLADAGLGVSLLSGDQDASVRQTGDALGISSVQSETKPDAKFAYLDRLRSQGHFPLMVGDGLNDAPSLAAAHASLSPSSAAEISQQASDAVFQGQALKPVVETLVVARQAKRMALQNFALAAIYNSICIPIAAAGYVTPLIAAVAMSASSIVVTANALRLRTAGLELKR